MNSDEVERLMSIAIASARVLDFGIAPGCQAHLRNALQSATFMVGPAKGEPPLPPLDPVRTQRVADARVTFYVAAMATNAIRAGLPPDGLLHEDNFFGVKAWICPCWPIC
jgi:hypothetical protein